VSSGLQGRSACSSGRPHSVNFLYRHCLTIADQAIKNCNALLTTSPHHIPAERKIFRFVRWQNFWVLAGATFKISIPYGDLAGRENWSII
jgi:hypothetical protein